MTARLATIYALSTPPGRGAVAIVRVSGPDAFASLAALTPHQSLPKPRQAQVRLVVDTQNGLPIDAALILSFAAPNSFTGENVVEYQLHGGISVVQSLLQILSQQENHRMAEPGEFTRRAFEYGRLDLTEAEAIADLIDAQTEAQRLQALDQLSGSLEALYTGWAERLTRLLALMEADLDFSDQDLPDDLLVRVRPDLSDLVAQMQDHLADGRRGERLREGIHIAVLGAPNAGKSSLVNALARRDVAIVSPMAGTTRDIIEVHLDIAGYPVIIADTAGLRDVFSGATDHDTIESEGISRALARAEQADLKVLVFDSGAEPDTQTLQLLDKNSIIVLNKADIGLGHALLPDGIRVSAKTEKGLDSLLDVIARRLDTLIGRTHTPTLTRARHRTAIEQASAALTRSAQAALPELAAEDIRLAVRHLGGITGKVDVEDLLDLIFRDFCIGK
jgi:tRNA modification GTPase